MKVALMVMLLAADPPQPRSLARRIVDPLNLVFNGVQAGWLIGGCFTAVQTGASLGWPEYATFQQDYVGRSRPVGPLLIPLALVANGAALFFMRSDWREPRFWLTAAGVVLNLGVLVLAGALNAPAVGTINTWSPATEPADWMQVRGRWQTGFVGQTIFSALAFAVNAVAVAL